MDGEQILALSGGCDDCGKSKKKWKKKKKKQYLVKEEEDQVLADHDDNEGDYVTISKILKLLKIRIYQNQRVNEQVHPAK